MISPIENNGMVVRTQDFSSMRQQENIRLSGENVQIRQQIDERGNESVRTVHSSDDSDRPDTHHDAKEEGRNKYYGSSGGRKKDNTKSDGKVLIKGRGGFDLKI